MDSTRDFPNILIYRIGSIGDTVVALPSLWHIRNLYPNSKITILTNFPAEASVKECSLSLILDGTGICNDYIQYPSFKLSLSRIIKLIIEIRKSKPDLFFYLMPNRTFIQLFRDFIFFKSILFLKIIGLNFSKKYQSRSFIRDKNIWEHESHRLARLIEEVGHVDCDNAISWDLNLSKMEYELAGNLLEPLNNKIFLVFSVGTKAPVKDWGHDNWHELIIELNKIYPQFSIVFVGSNDEYDRCQSLSRLWSNDAINLCGKISPRISAAVISFGQVFVGHDSGPMHLAACVSTPIVAIFSSANRPGEWYPYGKANEILYNLVDCYGCGLFECKTYDSKCIKGITVKNVINKIHTFL